MSKVATGFLAKITKADEPEVLTVMEAHPRWTKTYARRIVANRKFQRALAAVNSGKVSRENAEAYLLGKGELK
jgi:hypothetical protein